MHDNLLFSIMVKSFASISSIILASLPHIITSSFIHSKLANNQAFEFQRSSSEGYHLSQRSLKAKKTSWTSQSSYDAQKHFFLSADSSTDVGTHLRPKLVIFDLDGCLWRPEMYEIIYYSGGRGAPFSVDPSNPSQLLTCGNEPVRLLGNVREVMKELYCDPYWKDIKVGISSRTDEPNWAKELLKKFTVKMDLSKDRENQEESFFALEKVFENGPIEISYDSKVNHFKRISKNTGIDMQDILFFDNEYGNCESVAALGVTVAYSPNGVTKEIWNLATREGFPQSDGKILQL